MKKYLILILILFTFYTKAIALDIVYPKTNPAQINAESTFFVGSTNPTDSLTINNINVKVSALGAFAQFIPLNIGTNEFKIVSKSIKKKSVTKNSSLIFTIQRSKYILHPNKKPPKLTEYSVMRNFYVKNDNIPLRSTPMNYGINRMSHLQKGTQLLINGEKGGFYRVYLNSELNGWVAKSNIEEREPTKYENRPIKIGKLKTEEEKHFCIYRLELDKKMPFIIQEKNGLTLQIFNVEGQIDNTLSINIPIKKLIGYDAYYKGKNFILKIRKFPQLNYKKPLRNIIIVVDAGHGGAELGAIGCCRDKEKDINLAIAKKLRKELKHRGAKVIMTRKRDFAVSLKNRVKIAKKEDATLLISLHANALPDGLDPNRNRGTSVYYYHNQAKALAESILNSMTAQLSTQDDKVHQRSLALVRPTSSVSVLIEVAYIINPDDYALLLNKKFQRSCAKSIADGIEHYMLNKK